MPSPSVHERVPALDGVRGLAILLVLIFHYELRRWPWPSGVGGLFKALINAGWTGVDLFFVLSGFLITGILWRSRERPHYYRSFYTRRLFRIFPLYYVALGAMFFALPALFGAAVAPRSSPGVQAWFWTFTSNVLLALYGWQAFPPFTAHFWSLAVEEQFYMCWPFLMARVTRWSAMVLCGSAVMLSVSLRVWLVYGRGDAASAFGLTPARLDGLAMGAFVALVATDARAWARLTRSASLWLGAGCAALVALVATRGTIASTDRVVETIGLTILAFFWTTVLISALAGGVVARIFGGRLIGWVGRRSYALYVLHYPVELLFDRTGWTMEAIQRASGSWLGGHILYVTLNVFVSAALSELSWRLLESKMLRIRDRITGRGTHQVAGAVATVAR
jgi:peptidoglycan/LPS O-acetylase OafA/YrhL